MWNTSTVGCGSKLSGCFPQYNALCPQIVTLKALLTLFNAFILCSVDLNRLKIADAIRLPILARGRIVQNSMSVLAFTLARFITLHQTLKEPAEFDVDK